ncbi:hypothetical protein [Maribacter hydrothermalis]|uniref:Uncharacterized protein n=1 Tax=Maribacter hydrothermalis TaxID=1836467 RepID=A0A1B7Z9N2_9FLAO|nr:hypothetical protein [Maribacter hydrothermalis]APQ16685.1 hypothetical protein BTR34_04800 [Maribacter hydrothermalis]OBR39402.1 hypothetical protein A9200_17505 [Maribacter hydrothermalis]
MLENIKSFTILFCGLLCVTSTFGQQAYSASPETGIMNFVSSSSTIESDKTKGSPYLNDEFVHGEVIVNNKVELIGKMRYNAFRNEIEILDNKTSTSYYSLLKRAYIGVEIGNRSYNIYTYKDSDESVRTSYFTNLNEGKLKLLFKPEAILKQARRPSTSYEKYVPPTYVWNNSYYILRGSKDNEVNHAFKVRLTKKNILELTGEKEREMKAYVKENKLNLRQEKDVVSFLNYYNTL